MQQETAETIALGALGWLVGHDELLPLFLGASGAALADLRGRAAEPEFLISVMDFVLMDDAWVLDFAQAAGLLPTDVAAARQALPGGGEVHWT